MALLKNSRSTSDFAIEFLTWFKPIVGDYTKPKITTGTILGHEFYITEKRCSYHAEILEKKKVFGNVLSMAEWIHKQALKDNGQMNIKELKEFVIRPALTLTGLWCESAETLLAGTIMIESGGQRLKQISGPALGLYQIEPATHKDIKRYLDRPSNRTLKDRVFTACCIDEYPLDDALVWNLRYATLIARLIYKMNPSELPPEHDAFELAKYHKTVYNTYKGATDVSKTQPIFQRIIDDERKG